VDLIGGETADPGCRIAAGNCNHNALVMSRSARVTDHRVEGDATAGQRGALGQHVENSHGSNVNSEF
jgi:hypothetical protein